MENVLTLTDIIRDEIAWYAANGTGINMRLFKSFDEVNQTYVVTSIMYPSYKESANVVVLVRIVGDIVVVEEDNTDRPVEQRLMRRGIPRDKIVLAYRGEPVPDPVTLL
jgi:hypothetical protein